MTVKKRLGAAAAVVLLGAAISAAAPTAASAASSSGSCSGANLILAYNGGYDYFGCGTRYGNWWGFQFFNSGGHGYGAVQLNHNGSYYNLAITHTNQYGSSSYGTDDDAVEVWIGS